MRSHLILFPRVLTGVLTVPSLHSRIPTLKTHVGVESRLTLIHDCDDGMYFCWISRIFILPYISISKCIDIHDS